MGLFSSEDIYIVDTVVAYLLGENELYDPSGDMLVRAVVNSTSIPEALMHTRNIDLVKSAKKYYKYGESEYIYGLPEGIQAQEFLDMNEVKWVIEDVWHQAFGGTWTAVVVFASRTNKPDLHIMGKWYLSTYQDYDGLYNLDPDGFHYGSTYWAENNRLITTLQKEVLQSLQWVTITKTYDITHLYFDSMSTNMVYAIEEYSESRYFYFCYRNADGTYPSLNPSAAAPTDTNTFPIVPIIRSFKDIKPGWYTQDVPSIDAILKKIKLSRTDLQDELNKNPDREDVKHVFVVFGVDLYSEDENVIAYLTWFFFYLSQFSAFTKQDFESYERDYAQFVADNPYDPDGFNRTFNRDAPLNLWNVTEGIYSTTLEYNYIEFNTIYGKVQDVGTYSRQIELLEDIVVYFEGDWESETTVTVYRSKLVFIVQETEGAYHRVEISGLTHVTSIAETDGVIAHVKRKLYVPDKPVAGPNQLDGFNIPIIKYLVDLFPRRIENAVYHEGLNLTLYAEVKETIKWYNNSFFTGLIRIGGFFLSALALPGAFEILGATVGAALGVAATSGVAIFISAAIIFGGQFIMQALVESGNTELAILFAVATAGLSGQFGNLSKTFSNIGSSLASVEGLMALAKSVFKVYGVVSKVLNISEQVDFLKTQEELAEERESDVSNETDVDVSGGSPFDIINRSFTMMFGETPGSFYNRTIHNTNPGVAAMREIGTYYTKQLALPAPEESLMVVYTEGANKA